MALLQKMEAESLERCWIQFFESLVKRVRHREPA
jgi:hypothetical protein